MHKEIDFLDLHICIPAYKEEEIIPTLESLEACDHNGLQVNVSILVNEPHDSTEAVTDMNIRCLEQIQRFNKQSKIVVDSSYQKMPIKNAGVGLARKTLMDAASEDFLSKGLNGLIVALDADTIVQPNYLQEISTYFQTSNKVAASIYYEHPLDSSEIIEYEYHLRYYNSMQFHSGFPFAYHTVGSAMVCTALSYKEKGGMNKRKAGEDFYFMQKFIKDKVCGNITGTTIIPSSRQSDRVPFGTGRAVLKYIEDGYFAVTYNPKTFTLLKELNEAIEKSYDNEIAVWTKDENLSVFLQQIEFDKNVDICKKNTRNKTAFLKRFYQFFDGFTLMKCLHFMRSEFPDITIKAAAEYYDQTFLEKEHESVLISLQDLRIEEKRRFNEVQP